MNTKQALTLDPFPILDFKEASKKLRDIKIMQICEKYQMKKKKKKKKTLFGWMVGRRGWSSPICRSVWASPPVAGCVSGFELVSWVGVAITFGGSSG
jgi:hypothetical protein